MHTVVAAIAFAQSLDRAGDYSEADQIDQITQNIPIHLPVKDPILAPDLHMHRRDLDELKAHAPKDFAHFIHMYEMIRKQMGLEKAKEFAELMPGINNSFGNYS